MTSALGYDFVGFLVPAWSPQNSPPHFASKVSYSASPQTFAACLRITPYCSVNVSFMVYRFKIEGLLKNRVEIPSPSFSSQLFGRAVFVSRKF